MKYLHSSRESPSRSAIDELQRQISVPVPEVFLEFLKENNGGFPFDPIYEAAGGSVYLQFFFPLDGRITPNIVEETSQSRFSAGQVAFAVLGDGDRLLLDCESGRVFSEEGKVDYPSFGSFLRRLKVADESFDLGSISEIIKSGSVEALRVWVASGNSIEQRNEHGNTPIVSASLGEDLEMVKTCLDLGAKTDGISESLAKVAGYEFLEILENEGILPPED